MPYVKPEVMLALQEGLNGYVNEGEEPIRCADGSAVEAAFNICAVCGDYGCSKTIVEANDVFVHPEDVGSADEIDCEWR